jgi:DNA (cytosine-5)-methyltransferase 1
MVVVKEKPKVISFFSGCGGSSLGYQMAGCKVILAIDWEKRSVETYKLNFPNTNVIKIDIRSINKDNIFEYIPSNLKSDDLDILDGSPPCTPFSICGDRQKTWGKSYQHSGDSDKQRTDDLFFEYIRMIQILKPKIFIAENVKGLITGVAKGYFQNIISNMKLLTNNEYQIKALLVNAKDFEVPQSRERIIIYGIRNDIYLDKSIRLQTYPEISFYQATKDLEIPNNELNDSVSRFNKSGYRQYYIQLKQGEKVDQYHPRKSGFSHVRIRNNRPSSTLTTNVLDNIIHPIENRYLTLSECKRLATFPDNFRFLSIYDGGVRIGNSVPPKLIYHICNYLLRKTNNLQQIIKV